MLSALASTFAYFNPRPPRGGRLINITLELPKEDISIHAPREGGDRIERVDGRQDPHISIHAPREGGDPTK